MNYKSIQKQQKNSGYKELQNLINTGAAWKMEGSIGRAAMAALKSGACMLPTKQFFDYYGNRIPSRHDLNKGSTGTFQNSVQFYYGDD